MAIRSIIAQCVLQPRAITRFAWIATQITTSSAITWAMKIGERVKVQNWVVADEAKQEILAGVKQLPECPDKPMF
jgi:hypothetical protein